MDAGPGHRALTRRLCHPRYALHGPSCLLDRVGFGPRVPVPDDAPLFPDLTVEEHLAFYASIYNVRGARSKAMMSRLLPT